MVKTVEDADEGANVGLCKHFVQSIPICTFPIKQEYFISHFCLFHRLNSNLSQIGKYASGVSRSQLESQVGSSEVQLCFFWMLIGPTCDRCLTLSVSQ